MNLVRGEKGRGDRINDEETAMLALHWPLAICPLFASGGLSI